MRRALVLLTATGIATAFLSAPARAEILISISGSVVTASGDPVSDIRVQWSGSGGGTASVYTADDGSYTLSDVVSGAATLTLGDYSQTHSTQFPPMFSASTTASFSTDTSDATLTLPPIDSIPVTVTDTDGDPVPNATVDVTDAGNTTWDYCPSDYQMLPGQPTSACYSLISTGGWNTTHTDDNGQATVLLIDNPAFTAKIRATDPNNPARAASTDPFPAHDTTPATITLPTVISISGSVVTASGDPVSDIRVQWSGSGGGTASVYTADDGSYTLSDVVSGAATLTLGDYSQTHSTQFPPMFSASTTASFSTDTSDATLTLPPIDSIPVTVTDTDGDPVPNATVDVTDAGNTTWDYCPSDYQMLPGQPTSACYSLISTGGWNTTHTDDNGQATVLLIDNPAFTAKIRATDPNNPARAASTDPFPAHDTTPATITLPTVISISGSVVTASGDPVSDIRVQWSGSGGGTASVYTADDGSYTLSDVVSGAATLTLGDYSQTHSTQFPPMFSASTTASFSTDTSDATLTLPPIDSIPVTVTDTDGDPVPNATVDVTDAGNTTWDYCPSDYQMLPGQPTSACYSLISTGGWNTTHTDDNGQATVLLIDNPAFTAKIRATDPNNPARAASTDPFPAHDTTPATITLPDRPSAPQNPAGTPTNNAIIATWDAPASDGGSAITGYTVTATPGAGFASVHATAAASPMTQVRLGPNARSANVRNLKPGTPYTITVRATNAIGTGPAAQTTIATTGTAKPAVTAVSPASGRLAGGTTITLTGTGFVAGATVSLAPAAGPALAATSVRVVNDSTITARTPAASAPGKYRVTVATVGGTSAVTSTSQFTYLAKPAVSAVSPAGGALAGGTRITITGSGFVAGATVQIGQGTGRPSIPATAVRVVNATTIVATTGAATVAGKFPITITTPGGTSTASATFQYAVSPTVTGISPASGPAAGGTRVTITGTGFIAGSTVQIGAVPATNLRVVNATTIVGTTGASRAGTFALTVTTIGGTSARTASAKFTYV